MTTAANLGFPRIGVARELKWALERAWRTGSYDELHQEGRDLRLRHWLDQGERGIQRVPVGDFSFYDHMLDMTLALGAVPERFGGQAFDPESGSGTDYHRYFAMARGGPLDGGDVAPLEMTKWLDTNYHYLVPELEPDQDFEARPGRLLAHLAEAKGAGVPARVTLVGPVTFLALSKRTDRGDTMELSGKLLGPYAELVSALREAGAEYFQFDEPVLAGDLDPAAADAFTGAYAALRHAAGEAETTLATYFGSLGANTELAASLPTDVLHIDLVTAPETLPEVLDAVEEPQKLSLGVVDGRNIWRCDINRAAALVRTAAERIGTDRLHVAPSCSLLHLPVDLSVEKNLPSELRSWLSFATQRLEEVRILAAIATGDQRPFAEELADNRRAAASRRQSPEIHRPEVARRLARLDPETAGRRSPYARRREIQRQVLDLPPLTTTTIGSFPQTAEIRKLRRQHRHGEIDTATYEQALAAETEACVRTQEELGLDVLVGGELERTDMVEYFGDQLEGFATTSNGWVQSYGSRCVKPPVLYGDVARPAPMTTRWTSFAAGLTDRPVKAILTGPVTVLCWSFVRDDQPLSVTARQVALALRDEVTDLVAEGIGIIQIDEPALREGLPLRRADHGEYLAWAAEAFRLAAGAAPDEVQIHTHMCYAEFAEIIDTVIDLDADVISMEASRSRMELLDAFAERGYPNEVGPGIWDIHSPRVPSEAELDELIDRAASVLGRDRLWINPDCGLKTRDWPETKASLARMVAAARRAREAASGPSGEPTHIRRSEAIL